MVNLSKVMCNVCGEGVRMEHQGGGFQNKVAQNAREAEKRPMKQAPVNGGGRV